MVVRCSELLSDTETSNSPFVGLGPEPDNLTHQHRHRRETMSDAVAKHVNAGCMFEYPCADYVLSGADEGKSL